MNKALLQQALDALTDASAVLRRAVSDEKNGGHYAYLQARDGAMVKAIGTINTSVDAIDKLRAAIAQPESEPIGYADGEILREFADGGSLGWFKVYVEENERCTTPVYAPVQPERKGLFINLIAQHEGLAEELAQQKMPLAYELLTAETVFKIARQFKHIATLVPHVEVGEFAKAIERAVHGEPGPMACEPAKVAFYPGELEELNKKGAIAWAGYDAKDDMR